MSTAVLVRDGQTGWNRAGRVQGWAPAELTDVGHEQAAAAAGRIERRYDVDRLVTSDLRRAATTARYVRDTTGVEPVESPAWRERDFGRLQEIDHEEFAGEFARFSLATSGRRAVEERPESGESAADMQSRVEAAWNGLCDDIGADEAVVVVTHAGPLHVVTATVREIELVPAMGEQANGALNEVRIEDGESTLLRQNEKTHL